MNEGMENSATNENKMPEAAALYQDAPNRNGKEKKTVFLNGILTGALVTLCICLVVSLFVEKYMKTRLAGATPVSTPNSETVMTKAVEGKVKMLEDSIKTYYLDDVTNEELEVGIYKGIVDALGDPYSTYYTTEELQKLKESTEGIYYGIGAYVGYDQEKEYCKLTGIIPDTPAEEAGLKAEDILVEIDGKDIRGMMTTDVVGLIKGEENTQVNLKVFRQGETDYLDFTVTRRQVEAPTVTYEMLENGIAYIQIAQFEEVTTGQFIENYEKAKQDGMKALLLDLRSNPGGTLTSVVAIARQLLPEGLIVYTEDKAGARQEYKCDGAHQIEVPMVVLINENSASASEILAGAIKDYGVGTLVGTTTFGKGIVQKVFGITDGTAIKLTTSHYYTPKGNDIHKVGVSPDIEVELDVENYLEDGSDNQKSRGIEILTESIKE